MHLCFWTMCTSSIVAEGLVLLCSSDPCQPRMSMTERHNIFLGFYIRDNMSVELHIKNVCRSAYSVLRRISTIRHLLSVDSTKTLVSAFVLSRLDYCNSLLSGCPKHVLEKLQKVQNSAARLVLKAHKRDHVSPLLRNSSLAAHSSMYRI